MANVHSPTIQLAHGGYFNLLEPDTRDVLMFDIAAALSKLCRYNGHCSEFYSVAQHSVLVSEIIDPRYALWGLLHDASEAYLGDVSYPLKQLLPDYRLIEARVEACIIETFKLGLEPPDVKRADLVALCTEKRDLMPKGPDWKMLDGVIPHYNKIHPQDPRTANLSFMDRYVDIKCRN